VGGKRAITRADGDGKVVVLAKDQPPSKTSVLAHFRWWLGSGTGTGITIENEHTCSFSAVVWWWCLPKNERSFFGIGWVVVLAGNQPPSKMSYHARFRGLLVVVVLVQDQPMPKTLVFGIGWVVVVARNQPPSKTSVIARF
jgi:hypothetical protein